MHNPRGLTHQEVQSRISEGLVNRTSAVKTKTVPRIIFENIFSLFNLVILSIILFMLFFYIRTSDERLLFDMIGTSIVMTLNTLIAVIQEIRAKRALDKVSLLLKREVKVIREGKEEIIDQSDVVKDDLIVIERGDQIIADGKVTEASRLEIDESLLTGESVPVRKNVGDEVLSGSFCLSGSGYYIAEKVGDESYASNITKTAKKFKLYLSPLQRKLNLIVKILFSTAIFLAFLEIVRNPGGFQDNDFVRKLSTIMLSLVPQGLILMSSVTYALGIYRISKIGAIIQKLNAIESFSNVKVVCTDKTGTLTENKLSVHSVHIVNENFPMGEVEIMLGTYAEFSTDKNATLRTLEVFRSDKKYEFTDEIPFSSENKFSMVEVTDENKKKVKFILGAYDILSEKSGKKETLDEIYNTKQLKVYRNLLFGKEISDYSLNDLAENNGLIKIDPICIISITDTVRNDVMEAINLFGKNNIEIKILSGDNAYAIQAVAREIGWDIKDEELISGSEIDEIQDDKFFEVVMKKKIFARLRPDHKLRIIKALRKEKIYTAMIGDGVNDLPAIKESDMGIAMEEGSRITKEVADIVLLKNKFTLLPAIFDEGNKIVNTVLSVAKLFLTKNFMVIYLTLLSLFFFLEFPLTPRRVALINIFSIGLPSLIIALRNSDVSRLTGFTRELFSFVIISAAVIVASSFIGQYFAERVHGTTSEDVQMVMLSVIIIITAFNFLCAVYKSASKNLTTYLIYSFGLITLYLTLALLNLDFFLLNGIKLFYEITYLEADYRLLTFLIALAGSFILVILQFFRYRRVSGSSGNL
ncbi:MAG: HAD-IC family P-type ATPase [Ignavibacteria bacterium]|nr:HAD-IC family P-type ATPase [Ignavibacteria bacterium]